MGGNKIVAHGILHLVYHVKKYYALWIYLGWLGLLKVFVTNLPHFMFTKSCFH